MQRSTRLLSLLAVLFSLRAGPAEEKTGRPSTERPANVSERRDVVYARHGKREMRLDRFTPKTEGPFPAIVVVHGGGWLKGDKTRFRALALALASRGYVTAAIAYRLGGEARFPAALHDCNASVRFLRAHAREYRIDPARIGAVGGSAGGHLVGLMATAAHVKEFQGEGGNPGPSSRLQAVVVLAGPWELATGPVAERSRKMPGESNANQWLGKTIDEAPALYKKASPFTHIDKKTPPTLFMAGEFDHPERNAASRAKLEKLGIETAVIVVKGGKHGCWNRHPWFTPMVEDMDRFFRRTLR